MQALALCLGGVLVCALVACSGDEGQPGPSLGTSSGSTTTSGSSGTSGTSGTGQGTSSGGTVDSDGGTGSKPNGEVGCKVGADCMSGVCFLGNSQSFCSARCTTDNATTTCATPFTGTCNKQGYCKRD